MIRALVFRSVDNDDATLAMTLLRCGVGTNQNAWFQLAIKYCSVSVVRTLLEAGACPNAPFDIAAEGYEQRQSCPLEMAIVSISPSMVTLLLEPHADVSGVDMAWLEQLGFQIPAGVTASNLSGCGAVLLAECRASARSTCCAGYCSGLCRAWA